MRLDLETVSCGADHSCCVPGRQGFLTHVAGILQMTAIDLSNVDSEMNWISREAERKQ